MDAEIKTVILILTNRFSNSLKKEFERVSHEVRDQAEVFLLYHHIGGPIPDEIEKIQHHIFTNEILYSLNYHAIGEVLLPGNNHFPLFDFFLLYSHYDYYWIIEDDVRFNGNWGDLLNSFKFENQPDFISSHIEEFIKIPQWPWWKSLVNSSYHIPVFARLRSFNPIYQLSSRALKFLHKCLMDGWMGHHEVLIPTLLFLEGFTLLDYGGQGNFVCSNYENKFYTKGLTDVTGTLKTGSMRYRPVCNLDEIKQPLLYHPVKQDY